MKKENGIVTKVYENSYVDSLFSSINTQTASGILASYEKKKDTKELFECEFGCASPMGDLSSELDCGVKIVMRKSDTDPTLIKLYDPSGRLALTYKAMVKSIDYDTNTIYVSSTHVKEECRNDLIDAIENGIATNEYIVVPAVVAKIVPGESGRDSVLYINVARLGIFGIIRLSEWSTCYTESFEYFTKVGDVVNVVVLSKADWKTGTVYNCSRRLAMTKDPWVGIENHLPKQTKVRITCTSKRENNFFGIVKGVPDIKILCEYPDDKSIQINVGQEYVGFVYKVNEKTHMLAARIRSEVQNDNCKSDNGTFIEKDK